MEESRRVRLRLDFAYDGTAFAGWAAQPGRRTVEQELAAAVARIAREDARLTVAGRTDAGVHATGAVAHTDLSYAGWLALPGRSRRTPGESAVLRLNAVLPPDIVVRAVTPAPREFDARFAALWRRYSYRVCDRPHELDPRRRFDTVVHRRPLDVDAMDQAAQSLLGLRDFAAFCRRREGATTVRTLLAYSWERAFDGILVATVTADAFCHHMVRFLVGAVVPVGEGARPAGWPAEVLASGLRDPRVHVMPPHGLCLTEVGYPGPMDLATQVHQARGLRRLPDEDSTTGASGPTTSSQLPGAPPGSDDGRS